MLGSFSSFPSAELAYDTGGHPVDPGAEQDMLDYFGSGKGSGVTDILLISHGWQNSVVEAKTELYTPFFASFDAVRTQQQSKRSFGVVAIYWPSKKFDVAAMTSGGASSVSDAASLLLSAQLDHFADMFAGDPTIDAKIAHCKSLIPMLDVSISAQNDYVAALISLVPNPRYEGDEGLDLARTALDTQPGYVILQRLMTQPATTVSSIFGGGGAAGLSIGGIIGGIKSAAANLGNYLTYYTMKDRSGIVGRTGVVQTIRSLRSLRDGAPPNVHLVGHSFGGRLVTSAANALLGNGPHEKIQSIALLEAAYSHNGLSPDYDGHKTPGSFRHTVTSGAIAGPIVITHSVNDTAVGIAYPLASRLAGDAASALVGGPTDLYGGMGRNGAQHTPEVIADVKLADATWQTNYATFAKQQSAGKPIPETWIVNINGDGPTGPTSIGSHGDITKPSVARVVYDFL